MNLFVDSSAWIALFDRSDKYHPLAASEFARLSGDPINLLTSDYVFDEVMTFLRRKIGYHVAKSCGSWILATKYVEFIHVTEMVWREAWMMFQTYEDKMWAFTDCTSFVLMQQHKLYHAFTFDNHFTQAGFQRWPAFPD